jgi:hypothetical protein
VPSKLLITGIKYLFCPSTVQRLENFWKKWRQFRWL